MDKAEGMLVGELAELYGLTTEQVVKALGPMPEVRAYKGSRTPLGAQIVSFLRARSEPIKALDLAIALGCRRDPQPVRNRLCQLASRGIVQRVSHGRYLICDHVDRLAQQAYRAFRRPPYSAPEWDKLTARERGRWVAMVKRLGNEMSKPELKVVAS